MKFEINPGNVRTSISKLNAIAEDLAGIHSSMEDVIGVNVIQMESYDQVRKVLRDYNQNVHTLSDYVSVLGERLQNVVDEYEKHEQAIYDHASQGKTADRADLSLLWKFVGEAGVIGKTVSAIGNVVTGDGSPAAKWANFVSDAWDTGWGIQDVVETCREDPEAVWWKESLGWTRGNLGKIANSNLGRAQKARHGFQSVTKNTIREFKKPGKCVKQVGGIVFSGVVNAIYNYEEYKNDGISVGRAVAETVTETAVDWGKDLLIAAGVTAAFAAAGAAAPAVLVGVATVAVSALADWASEAVFGKKVTELVSDSILDAAEWAGDKLKTGARKVKEGVSAVWNTLTGMSSVAFAT